MKVRGKTTELEVDVIVFDKDGTLVGNIQTLQYIFQEYVKASKSLGYDTETESEKLFGSSLHHVDTPLYTTYASEVLTLVAASVWLSYHLPWPQCREIAQKINQTAIKNIDLAIVYKPNPGALQAINFFSQHIPVCIATSDNQDSVKRLLQYWKKESLIRYVITSDEVKNGKPAPDMLIRLSTDLQIPTNRILLIGDHEVDALTARNATAHSFIVGTQCQIADDWISDLQELVDLNIV